MLSFRRLQERICVAWGTFTMKRFAFVLLLATLAPLRAADPPGVVHLSNDTLKAFEKSLAPKMDAHKVATERLGNFGNHSLMVAHREGDGEAELHEAQADIFIVQTGEATLAVGGSILEGRTTAPGEIRGRAIQAGEKKKISAGDMVHIPAKVPHQVLVAKGEQLTYVIVKIDSK